LLALAQTYVGVLAHLGRNPVICASGNGWLGKFGNGTALRAPVSRSLGTLCR